MLDRCTQIPISNIYLSPSSWGDPSKEKIDSRSTWVALGRGHLGTQPKLVNCAGCTVPIQNQSDIFATVNFRVSCVISPTCVTAFSSYLSFTTLWAMKWLNFCYSLKKMQTPQYRLCNAHQEITIYVVWYKAITTIWNSPLPKVKARSLTACLEG